MLKMFLCFMKFYQISVIIQSFFSMFIKYSDHLIPETIFSRVLQNSELKLTSTNETFSNFLLCNNFYKFKRVNSQQKKNNPLDIVSDKMHAV